MERRVAVTGLGVLSCIGNDIPTFWNNLTNGVCGIDYITEYPTDNLAVKIGGMVRNFNPEDYGMDKPFIRKQDPFTIFAMASAWQAMNDSGTRSGREHRAREARDLRRFGNRRIPDHTARSREIHGGPSGKWISPNFVPTMISDMAGGQIAIKFNARGSCIDIVTACATSTHSIGEAYRAVRVRLRRRNNRGRQRPLHHPSRHRRLRQREGADQEENPKHASSPSTAAAADS